MIMKNICKKLVNYIRNNVKEENRINIGKFIRFIHYLTMFPAFIIVMFCNKFYAIGVLYCMFFILLLFIINKNICLLSYIENKLLEDDVTVVDPYLKLTGLDTRNDHRIIIYYFGFFTHIYLLYLIYYYRFVFNKIPYT
jgi:hypothetical protein